MTTDYSLVPLLLPSGREDAEHRVCVREARAIEGLMTVDGGIEWFRIGDPFSNKLSLLLGRCGDDYAGTLLYAGLPMVVVIAGGTRGDEGQYETEFVTYVEESQQEIAALFHEHIIGDLPEEGDEMIGTEGWPFPHDAANMVHEDSPAGGRYDLWHDLMEYGGSQGFEQTEMTGYIADSMWKWCQRNEDSALPEPRGF